MKASHSCVRFLALAFNYQASNNILLFFVSVSRTLGYPRLKQGRVGRLRRGRVERPPQASRGRLWFCLGLDGRGHRRRG